MILIHKFLNRITHLLSIPFLIHEDFFYTLEISHNHFIMYAINALQTACWCAIDSREGECIAFL